MSVVTPPTVDPLPPAPDTTSPSTFDALADAFLAALLTLRTQLNALAANVFGNATDAATSAATASASSIAATAASNASIWVSGTTYAIGDVRFSPTTFYSYRRRTAGAGMTDPSSDAANWVLISTVSAPGYLNAREVQPSGTAAVTATSGFNTRALNTSVINTITGASFSGNSITLPAGTYSVRARAPMWGPSSGNVVAHKLCLRNVTDAAYTLVGANAAGGGSGGPASDSWVLGQFSITATKTFNLQHYVGSATATLASPIAASGQVEVYSEIEIFKVA